MIFRRAAASPMPLSVIEPDAAPVAPPSSPAGWFLLRWAPLCVPLIYLAAVLWQQPPDHLGEPDHVPWLHPGLFDDYDVTALALRALNDRLGRLPGYVERPERVSEEEYARELLQEGTLAPRYYLEYPPPALALFRLGYVLQPPPPPVAPALLDGNYMNIVGHRPRGPAEQELYRQFRAATRVHVCLMTACLIGLILVLRTGYGPERPEGGALLAATGALLLLPGALYFTLNRFDIVPALLTALSLACLGRRWLVGSAFFLAVATMVKVYPVLLAPLVVRYLWPQRQQARSWVVAYGATVVLFMAPLLLLHDWQTLWAPYHTQLNRDPDAGQLLTAYGVLLPVGLIYNELPGKVFRAGVLLLTLTLLLRRPMPDLSSLLRRGALMLLVFVAVPVFWSPQWILWLAPLLLPLAARSPRLIGWIIALDLVNYLTFMSISYHPYQPPQLRQAAALVRCLILLGLGIVLLGAEWRGRSHVPAVAQPGGSSWGQQAGVES